MIINFAYIKKVVINVNKQYKCKVQSDTSRNVKNGDD